MGGKRRGQTRCFSLNQLAASFFAALRVGARVDHGAWQVEARTSFEPGQLQRVATAAVIRGGCWAFSRGNTH